MDFSEIKPIGWLIGLAFWVLVVFHVIGELSCNSYGYSDCGPGDQFSLAVIAVGMLVPAFLVAYAASLSFSRSENPETLNDEVYQRDPASRESLTKHRHKEEQVHEGERSPLNPQSKEQRKPASKGANSNSTKISGGYVNRRKKMSAKKRERFKRLIEQDDRISKSILPQSLFSPYGDRYGPLSIHRNATDQYVIVAGKDTCLRRQEVASYTFPTSFDAQKEAEIIISMIENDANDKH